MTSSGASRPRPLARPALRRDPLLVALLAAVVAGLAALWALAGPLAAPRTAQVPRVALVVDAGPHPAAALARASAAAAAAQRSGVAEVLVRVPRTASEAAADVRYLAAQPAIARVVTVGPVAAAAARAAALDYPGARFEVLAAVPRVVR